MHFVPELLVKRGAPLAIVWRAAHGQLKGVSKRDRERVRLLGSPAHPNPEANPVATCSSHAAAMRPSSSLTPSTVRVAIQVRLVVTVQEIVDPPVRRHVLSWCWPTNRWPAAG